MCIPRKPTLRIRLKNMPAENTHTNYKDCYVDLVLTIPHHTPLTTPFA